MFREELIQKMNDGGLISVYTNTSDTSKFMVGYVAGVDEQHFILAAVTPEGGYDGFILKELDAIFKTVVDGSYLEKMLKLITHKETKFCQRFDGTPLIQEFLSFAHKSKKMIEIEIIDSGYDDCTGFVKEVEEGFCKVQEIDEYGLPDGITTIKIADITQISCDETSIRARELLFELK